MRHYLIPDIMVSNIYVFYPRIEDLIVCQSYLSLVIIFPWDNNYVFFSSGINSRLIFSPTRNVQVSLNALDTGVFFWDFDQSVLVVGLQEAELYE